MTFLIIDMNLGIEFTLMAINIISDVQNVGNIYWIVIVRLSFKYDYGIIIYTDNDFFNKWIYLRNNFILLGKVS